MCASVHTNTNHLFSVIVIFDLWYPRNMVRWSCQETEYKGVLARVEAFAEEEGRRPRILVRDSPKYPMSG